MIELGGYRLREPLGVGAVGTAWLAEHLGTGLPVVVKILHDTSPRARRGLEHEVQATAALHHPGIVRVFDFGVVDPAAARRSAGALLVGAPWLVVEWCDEGSIDVGVDRWPELRGVLLDVLDALAHAHARGLLHGDIKPANVLRVGGRTRVKLSDFGLARAIGVRPDDPERISGSPHYMAPELWQGRWSEVGPPSDLYALGCLGWKLATGAPPFPGRTSVESICQEHLHRRPPPFVPRFAVPDSLAGWLRSLLMKDPLRRPGHAATAAAQLIEPEGRDDEPFEVDTSLGATWTALASSMECDPVTLPVERTTLPDWRRSEDELPRLEPAGVGLRLLGLRRPPIVGRRDERDALWSGLRRIAERRSAGALLVHGPSGVGTSALARWLGERALELGVAEVLWVQAGGEPVPTALVAALARHLGCEGVEPDEVEPLLSRQAERLGSPTPGRTGRELLEVLRRPVASSTSGFRALSPETMDGLLLRTLGHLAHRRSLVVVLDEGHRRPGLAALLERLNDGQDEWPAPILLVVSASHRPGVPASADSELAPLLDAPGVVAVPVGPLAARDRPVMVQALLGLTGSLAGRIEQLGAGHPRVVVDLVADLVARDALVPTADGFALRTGTALELPAVDGEPWRRFLGQALRERSRDELIGLGLGAVLGDSFDEATWTAALAAAGLDVPGPLLSSLSRVGLLLPTPSPRGRAWRFAHPAARAALLDRIAPSKARRLHGLCADALAARGEVGAARGRHLLRAGRPAEAFVHLVRAASHAVQVGDLRGADGLLEELTAAERDAGLDLERSARSKLVRARHARARRRVDEAIELGEAAQAAARSLDDPALHAEALQATAQCFRFSGDLVRAETLFRQGVTLASTSGDRVLHARLLEDLADALLGVGRAREAEAPAREALARAEAAGEELLAASCRTALAQVLRSIGRAPEAKHTIDEAFDTPGLDRDSQILGSAHHAAGEVERALGDFEAARRHYETSLRIFRSMGSGDARFAELNLALLFLEHDRLGEAGPLLTRSLALLQRRRSSPWLEAAVLVLRLEVHAARGAWTLFDTELAAARETVERTGFADPDLVSSLRRTTARCSENAQEARARAATGFAEDLAARLG